MESNRQILSKYSFYEWYYTTRVIGIQSKMLGPMYYTLLFLIIMYTVGYLIVYKKGYLETDRVIGSSTVRLRWPAGQIDIDALPYCHHAGSTSQYEEETMCRIWDEHQITHETGKRERSIFITTKVEDIYEERVCPSDATRCTNRIWREWQPRSFYYVAKVEDINVILSHSMIAPHFFEETEHSHFSKHCKEMSGILVKGYGAQRHVLQHYNHAEDIISVHTLLDSANVDLNMNSATDYNSNKTIRDTGLVLYLDLMYSNNNKHCDSILCLFGTSETSYRYRTHHVADEHYSSQIITSNENKRIRQIQYGILITVDQTGHLGRFSMITLLINIVGGLGLVSLCTIVVDACALYLLPKSDYYSRCKVKLLPKDHVPETPVVKQKLT